MLVYAPGQFFVEHQDSEKDDAMVGSLVVGLPSTFNGGALEVRHGGRTATYRGSKKALSFVAFYSDCRHEVKPVRSGYRVVLTYNLLLGGEAASSAGDPDPELVGGLARCLDEHFASSGGPDRLVYLLDHEYTRTWSGPVAPQRRRRSARDAAGGGGGARRLRRRARAGGRPRDVERLRVRRAARWYGRSRYNRWDDWDEDDDDSTPSTGTRPATMTSRT